MNTPGRTTAEFFEEKYLRRADPWDFAISPYEQHRYDTMIAAIDHRRYSHIFEPGCSIGVLTERLAILSERVTAIDLSPTAIVRASARCQHLQGVRLACASLNEDISTGGFDLVVLSEIGYYFEADRWRSLSGGLVSSMDRGATLLAAHWLRHSDDHCIEGDEVHGILGLHPRLCLEHSERHPEFRLDRWVRT